MSVVTALSAGQQPQQAVPLVSDNAADASAALVWERYQQKVQEKRAALCKAFGGEMPQVQDFAGFQDVLAALCKQYESRGVSQFMGKLRPSFMHVKSLTTAISSGAQGHPAASVIWGAAQLVLECGLRFTESLQSITDMMNEINNALPLLEAYQAMFPGREALQDPLREMSLAYLDFCVIAVKHLRGNQIQQIFKNIFTSSLSTALNRTKERIKKLQEEFDNGVLYAHRHSQRQQLIQISNELAMQQPRAMSQSPPSTMVLTPASSDSAMDKQIKFPVTTITNFQNHAFVGREDTLASIHDVLSVPRHSLLHEVCCVVLYGIGGVGKTQTALQYAFVHRDDYDAIFWVRAETERDIATTYSAIATKVGFDDGKELQLERAISFARDWMESTDRKWLLIFDNVEDIRSLHRYWPGNLSYGGSVLITTQKSNIQPYVRVFEDMELASLTPTQGASLIFNHLRRSARDASETTLAMELSKLVGGLPLAVVTIAGYVKGSKCSLSDFKDGFSQCSRLWNMASAYNTGFYEKDIATVFDLALSELSKEAHDLLEMLAFLNPDCIEERLLSSVYEKQKLLDLTFELQERLLIKKEIKPSLEAYFSMHRSLQWRILHRLATDEAKRLEVFQKAFDLVRSNLPTNPFVPTNISATEYPVYARMVPQILSLQEHSRSPPPPLDENLAFATLLRDIGTYLYQSGDWKACTTVMESARSILDTISYDPNGMVRRDVETILGLKCEFVGISQRAEMMEHFDNSLRIREAHLASLDPSERTKEVDIILWKAWTDRAIGYIELEQFDKAEEILEKALVKYKSWAPEEELPFEHSKYYGDIAWVQCWQQKYDLALSNADKGADLCKLHSGSKSGWGLLFDYHATHMYFNAGKHDDALRRGLEILRSKIEVFGEHHAFTLDSYYTTGAIHWEMGNLDAAEMILRKCVFLMKNSNWSSEHQSRTQYVFAQVLRANGKADEAEPYEAEANAVQDQMVRDYPMLMAQVRPEDRDDRMAVFDQMASVMSGRFTGRMRYGGALPSYDQQVSAG